MLSQKELILIHLKSGQSITQHQAFFEYGCLRLSAIIHILKGENHRIKTEMITVLSRRGRKTAVARYKLVEEGGM